MGEWLDYPRDSERFKYFVQESAKHGAKLELRTFIWLVERYTKPGDIILDPMSGIGTVLYAATMGRRVVSVEIAEQFVEIQRMNVVKLEQTRHVKLAEGPDYLILHMDCRRALPLAEPKADAVIFSPPYGNIMQKSKAKDENPLYREKAIRMSYDEQIANIGNITVYPLYLTAMREVYRLCFASLKPGGPMIVITKDFCRQDQRVYVSKDNLMKCQEVGFVVEDWHRRSAPGTILQHLSRVRREREDIKNKELDITSEDILVLRKPQ